MAEAMVGGGIGWNGSGPDVSGNYAALAALSAAGDLNAMADHLDLLLFAGRMSAELRQAVIDAVVGVRGVDAASHQYRARIAAFIALSSPEYAVQI